MECLRKKLMDIWNLKSFSKFPAAKAKQLSSNLPQGDGKHQEVSIGYS